MSEKRRGRKLEQEPTLYVNATILTMDRSQPMAEAILVQGDRIEAVGSVEAVEALASRGARRVDLAGQSVIPGFNDCHCHILNFGLQLKQLDVSVEAVSSIVDIQRALKQRAATAKPGEWVLGRGYDQNSLRQRRHPNRWDLDSAIKDHPVVLRHTSGHAIACNSLALQLSGVTASTETPAGGEIVRNHSGVPTGVLMETPAMDLVTTNIPPSEMTEGTTAILDAMRVMASQGITSASDASTGRGDSIAPELEMYRGALASGQLAGRITLMPQIHFVAPPHSEETRDPSDFEVGRRPDWLAIGPTKIFSDGALTTRTAALREPFVDAPDNRGLLIWDGKTLAGMIGRAHRRGWQIGTHAIGDRAIELVLSCYEQALQEMPRANHRHRIEHCMLLDGGLAARIANIGVVPTIQPGFMARLGDAYIQALGEARASQLMPMALFASHRIPVGFSSDRPVIPGAPLDGIRSSVLRTAPNGAVLGREHAVTADEAIRYYTAGSAYATHTDHSKGTLSAGKLADFAVLSQNPTQLPAENLQEVEVSMTVTGGNEVFQK